jgi:hypothetical protein
VLRIWGRRIGWRVGTAILAATLGLSAVRLTLTTPDRAIASAQDEPVDRKGPLELDDLETDSDKDGIPDGWYNARDVS